MPAAKLLQDEKYYPYRSLGTDEHFEITMPAGSDVDFELGEDPGSGIYWQVVSYDANVCRIEIEHDHDSFPVSRDKAEIGLKAVRSGRTEAVFGCGAKKVTVHFNVMQASGL